MINSFKQTNFNRCRFCGYIYNKSTIATIDGFIEKFMCYYCRYHWCIDVHSKFMDQETFFKYKETPNTVTSIKIIVNYRDNATQFMLNNKIKFTKPKAIKFKSYSEIDFFMQKYFILI